MESAVLNQWMSQAREHWKEHQPTRFKQLSKAGYREFEAWEIVRERYLFPPQEPGVEPEEDNSAARLSTEIAALHSEILRLAHEPDEDL